jgi:beta-N-acetylhexosaminidase
VVLHFRNVNKVDSIADKKIESEPISGKQSIMSYLMSPFDPILHLAAAHRLWQRTLGERWSTTAPDFESVLMGAFEPGDHLVALVDGQVVGLAATQTRSVAGEPDPRGEVMAVLVDPDDRRKGIGRSLLACGLDRLGARGCQNAQIGGGDHSYFWPGVPTSITGAWRFFSSCGWVEEERSFDLLGDLGGYHTPISVTDRVSETQATVAVATEADHAGLRELLEEHFPAWLESYVERMATPSARDIVVARSPTGEVIGMSCAEMPPECCHWKGLKADTGSVGALGVRPDWREKGVGLAIAAKVSETLQTRGVKRCFVGWTWLVDWYGALGYSVWEEYVMSQKEIDPRA